MVTLLHTADTHLGYRQYHRPEREADFRDAFYRVIEEAIAEDVDAVVHAGDLFNSSRPGIEALSDALEGLKRLREAGVPFLSIVGNHDGTRDRQWLDVFASLGLATRLDRSGFSIRSDGARGETLEGGDEDEGCHVVLYGLDHVDPGRRDRLDYAFDAESATEADAAVLVAHGLFSPFPNGDWDARAICRQSSVAFDAILAGDDHTNQETVLSEFGTLLTYPGSTERTAADQREARGYDLVRVSPDGKVDLEFRELGTRPFVYVDVELDDGEGLDRVLDELEARESEESEKAEESNGESTSGFAEAVVVVTLTGAGERVSSGPIEEFGLARDALTVRVNDCREFGEERHEYGEVAFVDPDRAVEQRRETLGLSENGRDIEALVRDAEAVPDSNVTDVVEGQVREWLDDRPSETFERTEPEPAEERPAEANDGSGEERTPAETATIETEPIETGTDGEETTEPTPEAAGSESRRDAGNEAIEAGTSESASVSAPDSDGAVASGPETEGEPGTEGRAETESSIDRSEAAVGADVGTDEEVGTEAESKSPAGMETEEEKRDRTDGDGRERDGETERTDEERTTQSTLWD